MHAKVEPEVKRVSTYCYQCVNGPDLLTMETVDGVATKIEPNFDLKGEHPADGKVCVKPFGLVQKLYNPDRIKRPMKRTNPKKGRHEDPGWVEISWDEALDIVAEKMNATRAKGVMDENGNPRLAFTTGGAATPFKYMGSFPDLLFAWGPFDQSLGAGGTVKCYHTEHMFGELWHRAFTILPDTPRCEYIISFGMNIDASGGVTGVRRHADARKRGMKRIQFEPHLSVTGANATEWIPIKTKTDNAVLFSMLHVLLHETPIDKLDVPFLKNRTASPYLVGPNGFYLRDPETKKPLVWDNNSNAAVPYDQADADPALVGTFTVTGAIEVGADEETWRYDSVEGATGLEKTRQLLADKTPEWAAEISEVPAATIRRITNEYLAHAHIGETETVDGRELPFRPVVTVLGKSVNNGWGAYECVWAHTMMQVLVGALEVSGGMLGSTTHVAGDTDWERSLTVEAGEDGFMTHTFTPTDKEGWDANPFTRHAHNSLTPMGGDKMGAQLFGSTTLAWLRLQGRAAESWPKPNPPDIWFRQNGFKTRPYSRLNWYLYHRLEDLGLRFELPYQERYYRMGKQLANRLHETGVRWWDKQLEEYEPLPGFKDLNSLWDEIIERNHNVKAADYPFWVLTGRSMQYAWGGNVGIQLMKEVADNVYGHDGIVMNAGKATEMGIEDGDLIEVTSPVNSTRGYARLRQGVRPDVVVMIAQFGQWKMPFAKDLKRPGLNALVPMNVDSLDGGGSSIDGTKVYVTRIGAGL